MSAPQAAVAVLAAIGLLGVGPRPTRADPAVTEPAIVDPGDGGGVPGFGASENIERLGEARGTGSVFDPTFADPTSADPAFAGSAVVDNMVVYSGDAIVTQTTSIDNSFNNSYGVYSVVQNAGNNVLIQNSTVITINMH